MLPDAEFAHNSRKHSTIKMSPFYAMMGYEPRSIPAVHEPTNIPSVEERLNNLQQVRKEAEATMELAQRMVEDRIRKGSPTFQKGQKVWLDSKNLHLPYPSRKLSPKREGPFAITEVMGRGVYRLALPKQWRIHPVFHTGLLSPYRMTDTHGPNHTMPPPDLIDGEEEYEVEQIINHRGSSSRRQYYVSWRGYPSSGKTPLPPKRLRISQSARKAFQALWTSQSSSFAL